MSGNDSELDVKFEVDTTGASTLTSRVGELNTAFKSLDTSAGAINATTATAAKGMQGLQVATAGVSRELIVLGHEALTGNFSRIPGTILTLTERIGGLSLGFVGIVGAIAGVAFGLAELAASANRSAEAINQIQLASELAGNGLNLSRSQIADYIDELDSLPNISKKSATSIIEAFAGAAGATDTNFTKMKAIISDFAAGTHQDADKASAELVKMMNDPAKAAVDLANTYRGIFEPEQLKAIQGFINAGDKASAFTVELDALQKLFAGSLESSMTGVDKALHNLGDTFTGFPARVGEAIDRLDAYLGIQKQVASAQDTDAQSVKLDDLNHRAMNDTIDKGLAIGNAFNDQLNKRAALQGKIGQMKDALTASNTEKGPQSDTSQTLVADMKQAYQQLADLRDADVEKEASTIAAKRQIDQSYYQGQSELVRAQHDAKQITTQQEFTELQSYLEQEWEQTSQLYDKEAALYNKDSQKYQQLLNQKAIAYQKYQTNVLKLQKQQTDQSDAEANKQESTWKGYLSSITSTFNSNVKSMALGQETLGQGFANILEGMLGGVIEIGLKMVENWALTSLFGVASAETTATSQIAASAAAAGAGAYAAIAAIPFVGPILAPAAAATAYVGAIAYEGLVGLDVGAWNMPSDGVYQLHAGESVVPKDFATGLRENGGIGGGGGGDVHLHVHTMDASGVKKFLNNNSSSVASAVQKQVRGGRRSRAKAIKG